MCAELVLIWIRVILLFPFCQIGSKRESRNSSFGKIRRYNYYTRRRPTDRQHVMKTISILII